MDGTEEAQEEGRKEILRKQMLEHGKEWDFEPTAWEADQVQEIMRLPVYSIPRITEEMAAKAGMAGNNCHENAWHFVDRDPARLSLAVSGWIVEGPDFVLHSVVKREKGLFCVTPTPLSEVRIDFIPDEKIIWIKTESKYSAIRNGGVVPVGLRRFPAFTIARGVVLRKRLLAGMDPMKAIHFMPEEFNELCRKHIPDFPSQAPD